MGIEQAYHLDLIATQPKLLPAAVAENLYQKALSDWQAKEFTSEEPTDHEREEEGTANTLS